MPSRFETFGIVAAESAAVGTPTVAFDIPALRELVRPSETGIRVVPFDVDAFAAGLERLANDAPFRATLVAGCLALGSLLRWKTAAQETLDVLASVASTGRRRSGGSA
jgi:glycosyltransferase involved in cell wall biosynthesis